AFHEPSRLRVADPRSGPRLCEAQRFMVPMRAQKRKEALHEPPPHPIPLPLGGGEGARRAGEGVVHGPNACEKRKGAFHEPAPSSSSSFSSSSSIRLLLVSRTSTRTSTRTIGFMVPLRDSAAWNVAARPVCACRHGGVGRRYHADHRGDRFDALCPGPGWTFREANDRCAH